MSKVKLNAEESYGLSFEEIKEAERYLRDHKTTGVMNKTEAMPMYELFLLGYPFNEIHQKYPKVPMGQLLLTASRNNWVKDRERLAASVADRIKARIFRSTVEQVEFLTDMVSVATNESAEEMRKYIQDPKNNPVPVMRIKNIKEYQQVLEMITSVAESIKVMAEPQERKPIAAKATKQKTISDKTEEQILLAELANSEDDK